MRIYRIIAFSVSASAAQNLRDYEKNEYIVVQPESQDSLLDISTSLNATILGTVGMLDDHYTLEIPKTVHLQKRSDLLEAGAKWWEVQTPYRHLYKRGFKEDLIKIGLVDPGFHEQWHLHNSETPFFDLNVTGPSLPYYRCLESEYHRTWRDCGLHR